MLSTYYTIKSYGSHEKIIQKSRFITYVNRAENEQEAIDFIQKIKKKHYDATHNCSAYIIGKHDEIQKANDDGEPSGTAGVPMLEVLKKRKLKNVVVVVTRYFGGIKLGAGGLTRAYSSATSEGIDAVGVVKRTLMQVMVATFDYSFIGKIENEIRNTPYKIKETNYTDQVEMTICVETGKKEDFVKWITNLTNGNVKLRTGDVVYFEENA